MTENSKVSATTDKTEPLPGSIKETLMFHLIGALSQYGKLGVVCIGSTPERARNFYEQTVKVLDGEC